MTAAIYRIVNRENNKFYVGSSVEYESRRRVHIGRLRRNEHHCRHLQAAWNKYGEDSFYFEIVETTDDPTKLQAMEQTWLDRHVGTVECYNFSKHADAPWRGVVGEANPNYGKQRSEETKDRVSEGLKDFYHHNEAPRTGMKHTEETREKISASKLVNPTRYWEGKERSEETRRKIGDTQRGVSKGHRTYTEEGLAKIRASAAAGNYSHFRGKTHTKETKQKLSRRVVATDPTGIKTEYCSITALRENIGIYPSPVHFALKAGVPIPGGKFAGWRFEYLDPTKE